MKQVRLVRDHNEGGIQHYAGQTVVLPDDSADWLISVQAGMRATEGTPGVENLDNPVEPAPIATE